MIFDPMVITLLLATGIFAGVLAGLFGVGGGLVIVPALYFLLQTINVKADLAMAIAVNTSLVSIIPTALSSLNAHQKLGNVDWSIVKRWSGPMVVGVLVGASLVAILQTTWFVLFFGCLLLLISLNKLLRRNATPALKQLPAYWIQGLVAAAIGGASAIAGVGGGATGVPALMAMNVPVHRAIGTFAALGLVIALPGSLWIYLISATPADAPLGTVHLIYLPALVFLAPATVICAPFGARLGQTLSENTLNYSFAVLLIFVGVKMTLSIF